MGSSTDKMTDDVIKNVKSIFLTALDKDTEEARQLYLDEVCGHDSELRGQVDRLLNAHDQAQGFLDPEAFVSIPPVCTELAGTVIGHYTLREKIGEGGMALVYRAEQTHPFHRQVAIKIIKLGMDTREVIARFEAERQVLAMMDHPNIARVLDAGVTESGKPYFVMELVQGISITKYCDEHKLNTRERLALFRDVCHAAHHAHQKGIIHRDLKPSNILVTLRDSKPVPKIIDFGIAKAIHQKFTDKTLFTLHTQLIGTPEYMSPEQAGMDGLDIDTRTDIYSLGVVLYELLVGTSPFDTLMLRRAAMGEIHRIIREEEPLRPSTRISAMGNVAQEIAARRGTNVAELSKRLTQELEWIPLKAMRKDRVRRYRSAAEFGDDIQNYLNDRPLLAGPESTVYRLRKAVHKYRIPVMAISAVIVTLIAGFVISTSLYMRLRMTQATISQMEARTEVDTKLSPVHQLYANGLYQAALEKVEALLGKQDLGDKALLLRAQLLHEVGQYENAENELLKLTRAEPQIAGPAHYLLARIYVMVDPAKSEKHTQLAESMHPQGAEGFYLRGMTAVSADEALSWLSGAVELDHTHYAARKARTFAYYNLKMYQKMAVDAGILIGMRPDDHMGHALRAIAHRELGHFEQALIDHAQTIELCRIPDELSRLYDQRRITCMKMGDYEAALEDARKVATLNGQEVYYPVFHALVAMKEYDKAEAEFKRVVKLSDSAARFAKTEAEKRAFDLPNTELAFAFPKDIISRSPFFYMEQAAQLQALLKEKAEPLPIRGGAWLGDWSPDGKRIAYWKFSAFSWLSGTMEGIVKGPRSGIEILDLDSGKARLVTQFGGHPMWSPDGRHIAFTARENDEFNIWCVPVTGGQPQMLTPGYLPHWSRDSQHIFCRATDGTICSMPIDPPNSTPVPVFENRPGHILEPFSISPDETLIAIQQSSVIHILTFPQGKEIRQWETPWPIQNWASELQWHPDGKTVILNSHAQYNQMGICLFNIEQSEVTHALNVTRPWCQTMWSSDGSQLIIHPYDQEDLWLMPIDPNLPLNEALAPAFTTEEFLGELLENWNQRIEADPLYADNYVSRAVVLLATKDYVHADQDLNRSATLITEPNDPAIIAIDYWAGAYKWAGRTTEAQLWASVKAHLAERFPELNKNSN
ncbi:MAG: protein kinase [Phycisphaerae bacterium]|nr:protein kinase [Phycisphaerae bacterium]